MTEIITRAAIFEPASYNAEKRTVQVIFSTGADVKRSDWEGDFIERLSMEPGAVDLSELRGAPLLDNHDRFSGVRAILGVVDDASVDGKQGVATVRFSERPEVQGIVADVQSGIIRNISAGYIVSKWEVSKRADGVRIKTATSWKPKEISFTALAADRGAHTRSSNMNESLQQQVRTLVELTGLPGDFADGLIQRNVGTIEDARTAVFQEMGRRTPVVDNRAPATITRDNQDGIIARMADGLRARVNPAHTATEGREFVHHRFADIARHLLQLRGASTLGSSADLITRALHTTSDFPAVLAEYFNKELLTLRTDQSPVSQLFKRATVSDFRARHILEVADGPALQKVNEAGEIKFGTIAEKEISSYKIASFARGFGLSFQSMVNDDLAALSDITEKATRGARSWFTGFLVDTIIANPKLADNVALFHASHANLAASGAVPSESTLGAGKQAMRMQKDLSGNPVDAPPKYLLIPAALESTVDKLMATLYPQQPADAIVSARNLTPIVDPRLDSKGQATAWYLLADPAVAPVFEFAELEGYQGPQVDTQQGFNFLGVQVRVVWHVGAGAIDSRGAWKNPGA